jgi:hypothetical protein
MILDRRDYSSWRDIQDAYDDYMASLGPWSEAEIIEFLQADWGRDDADWPFSKNAISAFFSSNNLLLENV